MAAIVDKNTIVSLGMNKARSDPGFQSLSRDRIKSYVHAEYDCLNNVDVHSRHVMYVVRVDRKGRYAQSRPCEMCQEAIRRAGIRRVVYTVPGGIQAEDFMNGRE